MKKHIFKILPFAILILAVASFLFLKFAEEPINSFDKTKVVELPPLEPLESEEYYYSKPEVEKLSYGKIVIENPAIAELKTYEQVEEYYDLN